MYVFLLNLLFVDLEIHVGSLCPFLVQKRMHFILFLNIKLKIAQVITCNASRKCFWIVYSCF